MRILCTGEMLIDFTPLGEDMTYKANPGGAVANVAVSTARNGIETAFLGVLGNDDFGRMLQRILAENHITMLRPELTDRAITTLAFVTLYEGGERSFTFVRKPGADILLEPEDVKESDLQNCDLLHAGSVSLSGQPSRDATIKAIRIASSLGKMVSFDVNYRDTIWHSQERCKEVVESLLPDIDFLKISDEETFLVGGSEENIPALMRTYNLRVIIETLGAKGARYYYNRGGNVTSETLAGYLVKAVDATGAGDAFWGGFLSRILMFEPQGADSVTEAMVKEALIYANKSGAICVQKPGGIPAIPGKAEIEAFSPT